MRRSSRWAGCGLQVCLRVRVEGLHRKQCGRCRIWQLEPTRTYRHCTAHGGSRLRVCKCLLQAVLDADVAGAIVQLLSHRQVSVASPVRRRLASCVSVQQPIHPDANPADSPQHCWWRSHPDPGTCMPRQAHADRRRCMLLQVMLSVGLLPALVPLLVSPEPGAPRSPVAAHSAHSLTLALALDQSMQACARMP
jgi:hypothetical protein